MPGAEQESTIWSTFDQLRSAHFDTSRGMEWTKPLGCFFQLTLRTQLYYRIQKQSSTPYDLFMHMAHRPLDLSGTHQAAVT
jgi:hypothetical protein